MNWETDNREPQPLEHHLEPAILAQRVESRVRGKIHQPAGALIAGSIQPLEDFFVAQAKINQCTSVRRYVAVGG